MKFETVFSEDRTHRYTLWREWSMGILEPDNPGFVNFICLNPSTATETVDDPTMRKCIKFAKSWGYGAMCVTNIFGYRATDPEDMKAFARAGGDPVGPQNDYFIQLAAVTAELVVCAWSQHATFMGRGGDVKEMLEEAGVTLHYFKMGVGKDPQPHHPLYLPDSTKPVLWLQ